MKKILLLFAVVICITSCDVIDDLTQFNMDFEEEVVIPASSVVNLPFTINTPQMTTNSESTFEVNDTRKDLVEEIKLTKLTLTLTNPVDGNFNFLTDIEVFIAADGLADMKIAWKENIANDGTVFLELDTTNEDIKEYIKKDEFSLQLTTTTDELISSDHYITVNSTFFVDAKILGV
ncbi:hypothetical protein [Neptunitalea lumnitzerae]|uniref:Uncharacterized protein n=1 Tax=Neptunitalea lumnitzerae TaxID=2965509 RepID=A0ABQ5MEA3_9FLAO|nr:hypothetical protein [Neptunitalea sp. Y10]GLB47715.1 hypothetical protein Y10_00830 [Neptunitalea sp. Y10]